jgi:HD-like signal output (HDOD) protein
METRTFSDLEIYRVAEKLPSAPRLLVELGQLMRDKHLDSGDVVNLLRQDPPLVAQIIRMANSAAYGAAEPVGSLEQALAFVGFAEVHRLVGVVANVQLSAQKIRLYPIDGEKLRLNALFVAVLMEELAKWSGESPQSCYTVGLLRTIGMMALDRLAPVESGFPPYLESGQPALDEWEQKYWGMTNGQAAEKILLRWRLPKEAVTAIRYHYQPAGHAQPIVHLLALAASAAAERLYTIPGEEPYWKPTPENFARAGFDPGNFQLACKKAQRKYEQLQSAGG